MTSNPPVWRVDTSVKPFTKATPIAGTSAQSPGHLPVICEELSDAPEPKSISGTEATLNGSNTPVESLHSDESRSFSNDETIRLLEVIKEHVCQVRVACNGAFLPDSTDLFVIPNKISCSLTHALQYILRHR